MVKVGPKHKKTDSSGSLLDTMTLLNILSSTFGINKLYLIRKVPRSLSILFHFYFVSLVIFSLGICYLIPHNSVITLVVHGSIVKFVIVVILNVTFFKAHHKFFFETMEIIDEKLKFSLVNEYRGWSLVLLSIIFTQNVVIWLPLNYYGLNFSTSAFILGLSIISFSHNLEILYMTNILRIIEIRLSLVRAHLRKKMNHLSYENDLVAELANECELSMEDLHQIYRSLFRCAEVVQKNMFHPITLDIIITFIKANVGIFSLATQPLENMNLYDGFLCLDTLKSVLFMFIPGSICSRTTECAQNILFLLADILTDRSLEKKVRQRLKIFHQECREKEFRYWLCRVIPLDVAMPAKFINLCITCLIIGIQFKKLNVPKPT